MRKRNFWRAAIIRCGASLRLYITQRIHNLTPRQRIISAAVAAVVVITAVAPTVYLTLESKLYALDKSTLALVGDINTNLAAKLTHNQKESKWQFNKQNDLATSADPLRKAQAGGEGKDDESLYSVDFPTDPKKGVTMYDPQTELSFTMTPKFHLKEGRAVDSRLVYPIQDGAKLIYTAKNNGMKEDIVLPKFIGKELTYRYELNLPKELDARIQEDGSVGIFSADPILFGNVSTATNMDAEKLKSAREQGEKNHLLFAIPAPFVVQSGDGPVKATAKFGLDGNALTVTARDMDKVNYPASIDPSVVITSSSEFESGNNEDNISYDGGQIARHPVTGGGISGSWSVTAGGSFPIRNIVGSAVYNGYLYSTGGQGSAGSVLYAPINSDGSVGTWTETTALPVTLLYGASVPHNGRLYVYGGYASGTQAENTVRYADINNDGSLGEWETASNSMAYAVCRFGWTGYNGYLYAAGGATGTVASNCGNSSTDVTDTIQYAQIKANGDVGPWTISSSKFDSARKDPGFAIYNNYAYLTAGTVNGVGGFRDTQIAKLGTNGSIGSWRTSTHQLSADMYRFAYRAYGGYLYASGGSGNISNTRFAQIYTNGDIGPWQTSKSTMPLGRWGHGFVIHKDIVYFYGGTGDGTGVQGDTQYARIDPAGMTSASTASSTFGASIDAGTGGAGFMHNGYLYYIGGYTGSTYSRQARYAPINANGSIGTWNTTSQLEIPTPGGTGLGGMATAVYGNRVYFIGGITLVGSTSTNVSSIQYASFNADGTLSSWTLNPTEYGNLLANQDAAAYNGTIYVSGYSGGGASNRVYRASINADGSVGSWTWDGGGSNPLNASISRAKMLVHDRYLYIVGGYNNPNDLDAVQYAKINDDGSLGSWTATTPLPSPRQQAGAVILNGYIYVVGGQRGSGAGDEYIDEIVYAKINPDGSVGSWKTSTNLSATFSAGGVAAYNDTIYIYAGRQGGATRMKTSMMVKTYAGGGGVNESWTTSSNALATARYSHGSVIYGGYIYAVGGYDSSGALLSSVESAKLNDDGSVGSWAPTTSLPSARANMSTIVYGSNIYSIGGQAAGSSASDDVYSAQFTGGGEIGSWQTLADLPANRTEASLVARNGYFYLLGGTDGSSATNTVLYAPSASGGTIGEWNTTTSFTGTRRSAGAVATGTHIYILGGHNAGNPFQDVQYAPIQGDGTIGSWKRTTDLPTGRSHMAVDMINGYLYSYGGNSDAGALNHANYAPLLASGGVGNWSAGRSFTNTRHSHQAVVANGMTYIIGGRNTTSGYYGDVQYSPINTIPRTATYSKLFDLGGLYNLKNISFAGTLPGSLNSIAFRTAGADGEFGSVNYANTLGSTSPSVCAAGDVRYVYATIRLDDSLRSVVADNPSSYVSSLTVNYDQAHPEPNRRLAHGKSFQDEQLKPLDTCG